MYYLIDPGVCVEPDVEADREVDASVPVNEDEDVEDNLEDSEGVGEVGAGLGLLKELEHSLNLDNPVESDNNMAGDLIVTLVREEKVKQVSRDDADDVLLEPGGFTIGCSEHLWVLDHYALIKVSFMSSNKDINKVEEVTHIIKNNPTNWKYILKLPEASSANDEDEVVHDSEVDDNQPFVVIVLTRVKCEISSDSTIQILRGLVITLCIVSFKSEEFIYCRRRQDFTIFSHSVSVARKQFTREDVFVKPTQYSLLESLLGLLFTFILISHLLIKSENYSLSLIKRKLQI